MYKIGVNFLLTIPFVDIKWYIFVLYAVILKFLAA